MGHTVTVISPPFAREADDSTVSLPSLPLGDGYRVYLPTRRNLEQLNRRMNGLPPVDLVHVQADFWGAILGFAYAKQHSLPTVLTCHTNIDHGVRKVMGDVVTGVYMRWLNASLNRLIGARFDGRSNDTWAYHARLTRLADRVIAPTNHFARTLKEHGTVNDIDVIPTGIDDDELTRNIVQKSATPTLLWSGRMSNEKRLIEYLEAIRLTDIDAQFHIYGRGALLKKAQRYVESNDLSGRVIFKGYVEHSTWLDAVVASSCVVQTSIGFETQGLTVTEAIALGTPVVLSDAKIAEDLPESSYWLAHDPSAETLARTLTEAFEALSSNKKHTVEHSADFTQSKLTKKIETIYSSLASVRRND